MTAAPRAATPERMPRNRHLIALPDDVRERVSGEIEALRADATARYTEVDLLVAALREHIDDLHSERDFLRDEVSRLQARIDSLERGAPAPPWLWRGVKPPHRR